jgi:hypothetical protein
VTEQQWSDFVAAEITPRFPKGLSIDDTVGQWRDPDKNMIVKEPSKDVTIVVPQSEPVKERSRQSPRPTSSASSSNPSAS